MTLQTILAFATPVGLYLALGVLNLLLGHKSQINTWAESNPRFAALLKLSRSLGLDPWMLLQSLSLVVRGRLPAAATTPLLRTPSKVTIIPPPKRPLGIPVDLSVADNRYPWEDADGDGPFFPADLCRGCGKPIEQENRTCADGCPCNSPRGVNHGLVPKNTCTCPVCDPAQTGGTRIKFLPLAMLCLLLFACGGSQPDPRALVDLTPLVCRSVLAAQRFEPEQVERICADSRIGAQLAVDIGEAVRRAALAAAPALDVGGGPPIGGGAPSSSAGGSGGAP